MLQDLYHRVDAGSGEQKKKLFAITARLGSQEVLLEPSRERFLEVFHETYKDLTGLADAVLPVLAAPALAAHRPSFDGLVPMPRLLTRHRPWVFYMDSTLKKLTSQLREAQQLAAETYGPFRKIFEYKNQWNKEAFKRQSHSIESLSKEVALMVQFQDSLSKFRVQRHVGVLAIEGRQLRDDLQTVPWGTLHLAVQDAAPQRRKLWPWDMNSPPESPNWLESVDLVQTATAVKEQFQLFDDQASGTIGKDDLRRVIESLDQFAPEEIDRILNIANTDGGEIVYDNFIDWAFNSAKALEHRKDRLRQVKLFQLLGFCLDTLWLKWIPAAQGGLGPQLAMAQVDLRTNALVSRADMLEWAQTFRFSLRLDLKLLEAEGLTESDWCDWCFQVRDMEGGRRIGSFLQMAWCDLLPPFKNCVIGMSNCTVLPETSLAMEVCPGSVALFHDDFIQISKMIRSYYDIELAFKESWQSETCGAFFTFKAPDDLTMEGLMYLLTWTLPFVSSSGEYLDLSFRFHTACGPTARATLGRNCLSQDPKFRTVLCWHWQHGECPFGADCTYAHGPQELRLPQKNDSILCRFYSLGKCQNGEDCRFSHFLGDQDH
eukprot:s676_g35.t1